VINQNTPLKIKALDYKDLRVISSLLQDAILYPSMMHYHRAEKVFVVVANRFCWEKDPIEHEGKTLHHRVHSGVYFSNVGRVRLNGIHPVTNKNDPHALLTVHGDVEGEIHILFSGGKAICLHIDTLECHLKDLHEPWWTHQKPEHVFENAA
jgi:hypothetical protein